MIRFYLITIVYALIVLLSLLIDTELVNKIILIASSSSVYLAALVWGVSNIRSQMFVKTYNSNPKAKGKVAITYDDGPDELNTPKLLDIFNKYNFKASFFLIGENIKIHRFLAEKIHKEGHLIANHTYFHRSTFPFKRPKKIREELIHTQKLLKSITGTENKYLRPPYGVTNPFVAKGLSGLGLKVIGWNIRSLDTTNDSKEKILSRIVKNLKAGDVILLHDRTEHVLWLTEEILKHLEMKNMEAVRVNELLRF